MEIGTKVSEMDSAGAPTPADQLYIIQAGDSNKITLAGLLANLPNTLVKFGGLVALGTPIQVIANLGTVNATTLLTTYTSDNALSNALNIDNGTVTGQLKIVINLGGSGTPTIQGTNMNKPIPLTAAYSAVILMWLGTKWTPIAGY